MEFNNLTAEQAKEVIQFTAEIYKLQKLIEEKVSQNDVIHGEIKELELEISEREKKLRELDI